MKRGHSSNPGRRIAAMARAEEKAAVELELKVGRTYRAKRPAVAGTISEPLANDRTIVYVGIESVQYDGPSVAFGRHYPRVSREVFLKWAARDVTDELPDGKYASWPLAKARKGNLP